MRTIVYIDGFNLYYGLLRHSPHKWLDLEKFVKALLVYKLDAGYVVYDRFFGTWLRGIS